jgi:TIR domain
MAKHGEERHAARVFLSHAHEDSDRFARGLAKQLEDNGVRVWFDEWELLPGDSLVDRIFEEGLKEAEAILVVLSRNSITRPWVREEMNAAFVNRVTGKAKLIPVLIDDVEVPEALRSTVHQRIGDITNYDSELDRILRAILGDRVRAEPAESPAYAVVAALPGLNSVDTRVLQAAGDIAVQTDQQLVSSADVLAAVRIDGITEAALLESLQVLDERDLIELVQTIASGIEGMSAFTITLPGFEEYAGAFFEGYADLVTSVIEILVNSPEQTSEGAIAEDLGANRLLVEHILDSLALQGLIRTSKLSGPTTLVHRISPQLSRIMNEGR